MGAKTYFLRIETQDKEKEFFVSLLGRLGVKDLVLGDEACDFHQEQLELEQMFVNYDSIIKNSALKVYSDNQEYLQTVENAIIFSLKKMSYDFDESCITIQSLETKVWAESWKDSFKAIFIKDDLVIYPPWQKEEDFCCNYKIVLNPGLAFGTGQHETTRLCLENILRLKPKESLLDIGTGSGILSILASKLSCQTVYAIDIDKSSIETAKANAEKNKVQNIVFQEGRLNESFSFDNFEVIVANIHY